MHMFEIDEYDGTLSAEMIWTGIPPAPWPPSKPPSIFVDTATHEQSTNDSKL